MAELGLVAWPPAPIRTARLVLREREARDRAAVIELFASPEVGTYIGGPRPRDELERTLPEALTGRPGRGHAGFTEVERFEEYGAEQWLGVWSRVATSG
jgi:RimJ/RimL family protein N-acetyltransferase